MTEAVTLERAQELDAFVAAQPGGHYMQTSRYGLSRPDYHWDGLLLKNDRGVIEASIALHSRPVRFLGRKLFYAPRGPVFTSPESFRAIIQAAKDFALARGGYLLRIDPAIGEEDVAFRQEADAMGFRFDVRSDYSTFQARCVYQTSLAGLTPEQLMSRFHSKTRYNIRLAIRRGVRIREGSREDLPVFSRMMAQTARRDGFTPRSEAFFARLLDGMGEQACLLLAEKDGQVLAGAIEVFMGKKAWYAFGCSFSQGREDMPNYLLQWDMMCRALERGCTIFDFRGVEGPPTPDNPHYGLHRFKQGFDAQYVKYAGQLDLTLRPVDKWLIDRLQGLYSFIRSQKTNQGEKKDEGTGQCLSAGGELQV